MLGRVRVAKIFVPARGRTEDISLSHMLYNIVLLNVDNDIKITAQRSSVGWHVLFADNNLQNSTTTTTDTYPSALLFSLFNIMTVGNSGVFSL